MKKTFLFVLNSLLITAILAQVVPENYEWDNVSVGGGGYILGVTVHPQNPDLVYIRTDVGGAYRWDTIAQKMVPLTDWVPFEQSNLYGVYGLALHPEDENIIYLSLGKYINRPGDVFKSEDQGKTWEPLNFDGASFGANHSPNRKGNTLLINPHNPDELYAGTIGNGLHRYHNGNWEKITTIPGDAVIRSLAFDSLDSNYIYVAVTYSTRWGNIGNPETSGIYRSADGGQTFNIIPGFNRQYDQFSDLSLSKDCDKLYASSLEHDGKTGTILRLDNPRTDSTWTNITPESGPFRTVTASPHDNDLVMTARGTFNSLGRFAISENSGTDWTFKSNFNVHNIVPWHPSSYPGSAISQIAFDPANPDRVYFTDWYSIYMTDNWRETPIHWSNEISRGHEEIVPARIVGAHPENDAGAILYAGGADISGLTQLELDDYTTINNWRSLAGSSKLQEVSGIDFCEAFPNVVVAMGGQGWGMNPGGVFVSHDGGKSFSGTSFTGRGGKIAVSALNPDNFVTIDNTGAVRYTKDGGKSFHSSSGAGIGYGIGDIFSIRDPLASDRVNGKFYLYSRGNGRLMASTDGGENFSQVGSVGISNSNFINLKTVPGIADNLWVTNGIGLHHSSDGGETWTKHSDFAVANYLAIGKAQTPEAYPAIYVWGRKTTDTQVYFYRSVDGGVNFEKVNITPRAGNDPMGMGADLAVFGRFYIATNGTGIFYAQIVEDVGEIQSTPIDLAVIQDNYHARLTWGEAPEHTSFFRIEKQINSGDWTVLSGFVPATQSTFTDKWLESSATYKYRIRAFNQAGHSQWSDEAILTTGAFTMEDDVTLEAEDGRWDRTASEESENQGFSGTGYVVLGNQKGSWNLLNLLSPRTGLSTVSITYANGSAESITCDMYINGVKSGEVTFAPTGGWNEWSEIEYPGHLKTGHNTLLIISNSENEGLFVDNIIYTIPDIGSNIKSAELQFNIYPNPVEDIIRISYTGWEDRPVKATIIDMPGRVIDTFEFVSSQSHSISLGNYHPGIYILQLEMGLETFYHKIIRK